MSNALHRLLMDAALVVADQSKDLSRKTGCVITFGYQILVNGYNRMPDGVRDLEERRQRPEKYFWTEHAERDAIYKAAKQGVSLVGATMYTTLCPCMDCARAAIGAGIVQIVTFPPPEGDQKFGEDFARVGPLLSEAGVELVFLEARS